MEKKQSESQKKVVDKFQCDDSDFQMKFSEAFIPCLEPKKIQQFYCHLIDCV